MLGVVSAVGGGVLRDTLAGEVPVIFRQDSELYAVPALLGAVIVAVTVHVRLYGGGAATGAVCAAVELRLLALWRGWRAPRPL